MAAPKIALRKIAELKPDPRNARVHSDEQVAVIAASIDRFGWTNPILADDLIRAGHGRLMAARLIDGRGDLIYMAPGRERGGAALPRGTVPVIDCTGWSEDERKAYGLADNQIALQATWNLDELMGQLDELGAVEFDLGLIGFDHAALDALAEPDPEDPGTLPRQTNGELADSTFNHQDQFAVIVRCADEAEQEARFNTLRDQYGAENVKVVVV